MAIRAHLLNYGFDDPEETLFTNWEIACNKEMLEVLDTGRPFMGKILAIMSNVKHFILKFNLSEGENLWFQTPENDFIIDENVKEPFMELLRAFVPAKFIKFRDLL